MPGAMRDGSLFVPVPSLPAVRTAPYLVVTGGNDNLRRCVRIHLGYIDVSYIKAKSLAMNRWLHLGPGKSSVGGVEESARLPTRPHILIVACVT